MPKTQDRIFLFADDFHVADACAHQFYADAIARLQTLEPTVAVAESPSSGNRKLTAPYKTLSFVARANAWPIGTKSVVDLMELEMRINAKCDPSASAIFEPDEYPGLVWLDISSDYSTATIEPDMIGGPASVNDVMYEMKTIVFPSGAIVVHGSSMEKMEESVKRKLPLIQKCMREAPTAVEDLIAAAATAAPSSSNI
jgi:hypothetical protein